MHLGNFPPTRLCPVYLTTFVLVEIESIQIKKLGIYQHDSLKRGVFSSERVLPPPSYHLYMTQLCFSTIFIILGLG